MSGAPIGSWDVVDRIVDILDTHLQTKLTALTTLAGVSWTLTVADVLKGSNEDPRQRANTVMVFEDSANDDPGQFQNWGGPVRQTVEVWIRANVMPRNIGVRDLDMQRSIYATAIKSVIEEHWRADGNPANLFGVTCRAAHGASSVRRTRGIFGTVAGVLGFGGGGQDTLDPVRVVATCRQYRDQPVQLT